ncbi:hypothetical protein V6N13_032098 [Hibiscus sabdariffa]|uniref:Uncharacterized protein n=2 Tax=Hibiscus sabdariffa TaxID=183260 RepID=A0ABR1ZS97_9ROSI
MSVLLNYATDVVSLEILWNFVLHSNYHPLPHYNMVIGSDIFRLKRQEATPRAKGSIRYLHGEGSPQPKFSTIGQLSKIIKPTMVTSIPNLVADAESTNVPTIPVEVQNIPLNGDNSVPTITLAQTKVAEHDSAYQTKANAQVVLPTTPTAPQLAAAFVPRDTTVTLGMDSIIPTATPVAVQNGEGDFAFLTNPDETKNNVSLPMDKMGIPWHIIDGLDNDMATNENEAPILIPRGTKRRSSMQDNDKVKKPRPPCFFKD